MSFLAYIKHCLFLLLCISNVVQAKSFKNEIQSLIDQYTPESTVSILIKNQEQDKIIYSKNADKLLMPASGIKLFPAVAALYQ